MVGSDAYDRKLARCEAGGEELSQVMVRGGFAFAFPRYSELVAEEREARAARRGIWQGTSLEAPWDYRAAQW